MTFRTPHIVLICGVLLLGATFFVLTREEDDAGKKNDVSLAALGFSLANLGNFEMTAQYGNLEEGKEVHIAAESDNAILRIKAIPEQTKEQAERYITGQSILLEAQYDSRLPPYPEFLTNQTGCAEELKPRKVAVARGAYYLVHADERFNYGLCADDLIQYKSALGLFYCPESRSIFQIEYFIDADRSFDDVERFISSFRCAPRENI